MKGSPSLSINKRFAGLLAEAFKTVGEPFVFKGTKHNGVFRNDYVDVDMFGNEIESNSIELNCATVDVDGVSNGDVITQCESGVNYRVANVRPVTGGRTVIQLREPN